MKFAVVLMGGLMLLSACGSGSSPTPTPTLGAQSARAACERFQQLFDQIQAKEVTSDAEVRDGIADVGRLATGSGNKRIGDLATRMTTDIDKRDTADLQSASAELTQVCTQSGFRISAPASATPSPSAT